MRGAGPSTPWSCLPLIFLTCGRCCCPQPCCEATAPEVGASLKERLLPLAEGSCGPGFGVQVLGLGDLRALGDLSLSLSREQPMVAGCQPQNLSTGWVILGDPRVPPLLLVTPGSHTLKWWPISVETGKTGSARKGEPPSQVPLFSRVGLKCGWGRGIVPPCPQLVVPTPAPHPLGLVGKGEERLLEFLPPSLHFQEWSTYYRHSPGMGLWESQIRPLPSDFYSLVGGKELRV